MRRFRRLRPSRVYAHRVAQPTNGAPGYPNGWSFSPEPPPPRRTRWALVVGIGAGLVLLLVTTVASLAIYRFSKPAADPPVAPAPTTPSAAPTTVAPSPVTAPTAPPPPSPAPSPSIPSPLPSTPSPTPAPRGPNTSLQDNALYVIDLDGRRVGCKLRVRDPRPPLKNSALAPYLRDVVDCLVKTFRGPLEAEGFTLATPSVKTYAKTIKTPCGKYDQDKAPAFYCSVTQTIYWAETSDDGHEAYTYARLGYVGLIAHEFGHHVQAATGMLSEYGRNYYATEKSTTRYALSRRLELQAQCFEGVFFNQSAASIKLSASDRFQLRSWHGYTGDEDPPRSRLPDHGTSTAQVRWLFRGMDSADFARCNTWKANPKSVK